ncbi:MAG: sigma-54-dependent Fis family transcriptional regulator [Deltaproteobacteria bacterium]|nr:sigma-54-dependent Fis family transcriptional regulator [Deltaproteobacteria bacterium]
MEIDPVTSNASILIVDDDEVTAMLLRETLQKRDFNVDAVTSAAACLDRVRAGGIDVVVTDVQMPDMNGIELCTLLSERHPDMISIVLTGMGDLEMAIAAMRAGAYDFLTKPVKSEFLAVAIRRATEHLSIKRHVKRLTSIAEQRSPIDGIAGSSAALRETTMQIRQFADTDATVLIMGESGTGKELVARALHELSPRRSEPFVAINCAAMPAPLLESELFGHVRGAFTDAKTSRSGLFVQAGRGTILLDEIGDMPLEMQVKLLRVLQERTVRPVGGDEEVPFEARVITATNRDLATEVDEKRFREDLFHRINVVAISVPPLRERSSDVMELTHHVLARISARSRRPAVMVAPDAARKLINFDWPGNVRELENTLERAVAVSNGIEISVDDLPMKIRQYECIRMELPTLVSAEMVTLDEMQRRYVKFVLNTVSGNKTHAARILGMDRRSVYRWIEPA